MKGIRLAGITGPLGRPVRVIFLVIAILLLAVYCRTARAANWYVRDGAIGSETGADWENAYTALPSILNRGDTYYIADGTYGAVTIDTPESGSSYIYIKKASATDHGTDAGWDNAYGDGVAAFTSIFIDTGYVEIDGSYGKLASDMPGYVPYGITMKMYANPATSNKAIIRLGQNSGPADHITLRHMEAAFTNTPFISSEWNRGWDIVDGYGDSWTIDYFWGHHAGDVIIGNQGIGNYQTITNSVLEKSGIAELSNPQGEHSEIIPARGTNFVFKNNIVRDWASTGGIILFAETTNRNWLFTGNVFTQTGYMGKIGEANGVLNGLSASVNDNITIVNNTFVNMNRNANIMSMGTNTNVTIKNNVFDNCSSDNGGAISIVGNVKDYNFYRNVTGQHTEEHKQTVTSTSSSLVAPWSGDYHLKYATKAGDPSVGTLYGIDPDGKTRGLDGIWDRGAFEFSGSLPPPSLIPNPPTGIRVE